MRACLIAAILLPLAACQKRVVDLSGRPCRDGKCMEGFACHPDTQLCVPAIKIGCATVDEVCPSQILTGSACATPGSFVPCCDSALACENGCRTCLPDSTWSACPTCADGTVVQCAGCCDNCLTRDRVSAASCVGAAGAYACRIDACMAGYRDGDGLAMNGCETQCPAVPDLCDGLDNDCDGKTDTADTDLDTPAEVNADCGAQHCTNCNVTAWACTNGACAITGCSANKSNLDPDLDNGCEYDCTPNGPEICDNFDNDCDGQTNTFDPDLDSPAEINADCAQQMCATCGVAQWACNAGACQISQCASGRRNVSGGDADGCECMSENDLAFCGRLNAECGPFSGTDNCGDARSTNCGGCTTPEICGQGGGLPNLCRSWWDCAWQYRHQLTITTTTDPVPAPYTVRVDIDHAALVAAGRSLPSGNDVRILRRTGTTWTELDRVLDPDYAWNQPNTRLWFATQSNIAAGSSDAEYFLYYGNSGAGAPLANEAAVFLFADFFDRPDDANVGRGWLINDASTGALGNIDIAGGALYFPTTNDYNNRPSADHTFNGVTTYLVWRLGLNWSRPTGSVESTYRFVMQLGDRNLMTSPPVDDGTYGIAGVGPSLVWFGINQCSGCSQEGFGYELNGTVTQLTTASGLHRIGAVVDVTNDNYTLFVDGTQVAVPFFSSSQTTLSLMRLMTWQISDLQTNIAGRQVTYVIVRSLVFTEPTLSASAVESSTCN